MTYAEKNLHPLQRSHLKAGVQASMVHDDTQPLDSGKVMLQQTLVLKRQVC